MTRFIVLIACFVAVLAAPTHAKKDDDSLLEDVVDEIFEDDEHPGKGHGRPDNPGEHGRDNAAEKQSRGHGNGSKKNDSWADEIRDEIDADGKKTKGNKKNKK